MSIDIEFRAQSVQKINLPICSSNTTFAVHFRCASTFCACTERYRFTSSVPLVCPSDTLTLARCCLISLTVDDFLLLQMCRFVHVAVNTCINCSFVHSFFSMHVLETSCTVFSDVTVCHYLYYYYSLLRQKAAQPLQIQHTINKTVKEELKKKLIRKSGKTVKLSLQTLQMFSDVNKTFLSRPRPRLWVSRPRPRSPYFFKTKTKTF